MKLWGQFSTIKMFNSPLKLAGIERSRCVDSQAWYFFSQLLLDVFDDRTKTWCLREIVIFTARDGVLKADLEYPVHQGAWPVRPEGKVVHA